MRRNKGFTLPEVAVSLVIFAIAAGVIGTVVTVSMNIFRRNAELSRAQLLGDGVYDFISQRLAYGKNITAADDMSEYTKHYSEFLPNMICVQRDGKILAGNSLSVDECVSAFSKDFYGDMTVKITLRHDGAKPEIIELSAEVSRGSDMLYSRESTVRMMNSSNEYGGFLNIRHNTLSNQYGDLYIVYTSI